MLPGMAFWKKKRMNKLFSKDFYEYDIICLQEHFLIKSPIFKWLGPPREMIDFSSTHSPRPKSITKIVSGGLSIYTRYEIMNTSFQPFSSSSRMDILAEKGILYAKVSHGPGRFLHVFNIHLQAGESERTSEIRRGQMRLVEKFIFRHTQTDRYPIILTGDFNENVSILEMFLVRRFAAISKPLHTYKNRCLDYIIIQQDRMVMMGHDQRHSFNRFSDHAGISVVTFPV